MRHILPIALFLAVFLAACGGPAPAPTGGGGGTELRLSRANFGDADPASFGMRGPAGHPVHGIDVSRFQGPIDWRTARENGVTVIRCPHFIPARPGAVGRLLHHASFRRAAVTRVTVTCGLTRNPSA